MTIQQTAGKLLVYFYQLQRTAPLQVRVRQIVFASDNPSSRLSVMADKRWLTNDLQAISNSAEDMLNAMHYLCDKKLIRTSERSGSEKRVYTGHELTASGIAMVEAVQNSSQGAQDFNQEFQTNLASETKLSQLTDQLLGV